MQKSSRLCKKCYGTTDQTGDRNPHWRGGKTYHKAGYLMVLQEGGGYRFEHVLVMEEVLGRSLLPGENVHHLNGVKDDNRSENLELWTKPQPSGIRTTDAVAWAHEILDRYG